MTVNCACLKWCPFLLYFVKTMTEKRTRIIFICTGNIARSQIAEGWARHLGGDKVEVFSAGTRPNPKGFYPAAIQVMAERGIDISNQRSKGLDKMPLNETDIVVTLCDSAESECASRIRGPKKLHWSIPDPGNVPESERLSLTRTICIDIEQRVRSLLSSAPFHKFVWKMLLLQGYIIDFR